MLHSDVDRHKGRWLLLVATLILVLCGVLFAIYSKHHRPIRRAMNAVNAALWFVDPAMMDGVKRQFQAV